MNVPVLPAFYFGSVEHYRFLARHERVIIDTGEHYERQSYRTRTSIVGPNGRQDLTVQIARRSGEKMPMRTVGLSYDETWPQQHVHALRTAYGQTPWFIHYIGDIEAVLLRKYDRLIDLDLATMRLGLKWLGSRTEIGVREEYVEPTWRQEQGQEAGTAPAPAPAPVPAPAPAPWPSAAFQDLRTTFHPKRPLPEAVTPVPPYPQVFADRHGFVPRLSVIDLVCNCGPEARRYLLA